MSHHHRRLHHDAPVELAREILSRLPVKALVRFLCLSKSWCGLIKASDFMKMQLKHSNRDRTIIMIANDDPRQHSLVLLSHSKGINIVGYCDGLVCVHDDERKEIEIWNPLIRRCKRLPNKPIEKPFRSAEYVKPKFGFGYDPHNEDYKVMRPVEFFDGIKPVLDF
ncbi:f-box/kelch-repeat protein [Quercus suber]|uniref:F-box/kelch-repeat protein n=1 Tax=Quercus suber TaxID=58331 RepID=A0AAW0LJS9_QUESU